MKKFILIAILLFMITSISQAQNQVVDTHPGIRISAIDYQSGNQVFVSNDQAILFKNAFIDMVSGTRTGRSLLQRSGGDDRRVIITQADPQANGNAFQMDLQRISGGQTSTIFTFIYNVDQNALYYYDPGVQKFVPETINGRNINNLNDCNRYGNFNMQNTGAVYTNPVDVNVSVALAPPPLPDYEQPQCPADGYLWQPGYWAYSRDNSGYYWVPGVWIAPPSRGVLWTPPYWGFEGSLYVFHAGYWGHSVGFYGGINYGYGYQGTGFIGGEWHGTSYRYNTAVVRVNVVNVHNTYINKTVINNVTVVNHNSFNGPGGVNARPSDNERRAMQEKHVNATPEQIKNQWAARNNKGQFVPAGRGGKPANLALVKAPVNVPVPNRKPGGNPGGTGGNPQSPNGQPNGASGNRGTKPGASGTAGTRQGVQANPGTRPGTPAIAKPNPQGTVAQKPGNPGTAAANPNPKGTAGKKYQPKGTIGQKPLPQGNTPVKIAPKGNIPVKPVPRGNHGKKTDTSKRVKSN